EAARMLGVSRWMLVREVLVPGAAPMIFTGLRLSLQACGTTLVAGELIGAAAGLGRVLSQGALDIFPAMILVGMVGVAVAGGVMTWALGWIERRAIAWLPFAALWFGTGIGGPVLIIFSGAFPPCVINAYRGAKYVEPRYIEAARTLGVGNVRMVTEVLLPASVPSIVAGLRISAGLG